MTAGGPGRLTPAASVGAATRPALTGERGSVLILTLWTLFFLAALALAVGAQVAASLTLAGRLRASLDAGLIARAGADLAAWDLAADTNGWDSLDEPWADSADRYRHVPFGVGEYSLRAVMPGESGSMVTNSGMIDEERFINLNRSSRPLLEGLLMVAGQLGAERARELSACIIDWRDRDNNQLTGGAESGYYEALAHPYSIHNGDFSTVVELRLVKGVEPALFERICPFLTVHGQGLLNVNTADGVVLKALAVSCGTDNEGAAAGVVSRLISARRSGVVFRTKQDVAAWPGAARLPSAEASLFGSMLSGFAVRSSCFRGEVWARCGESAVEDGHVRFVFDRTLSQKVDTYEF